MKMILSVLNLKGGSGKSTLSTNIAVSIAMQKKKVLIVDTDAQQKSSLNWAAERPEEKTKVHVISIPNDEALKKQIREFEKDYDVIVIDGAPQIDKITRVSIAFSDVVVIPVTPSPYDFWATESIVQRIKEAQDLADNMGKSLKAYFVINRDSPRTLLSKELKEALENLEIPICNSRLHNRIAYADSANNGLSVLEWADNKAREEVESLVDELQKIINIKK